MDLSHDEGGSPHRIYTRKPRNINLVPIDYSFDVIQEINEIAAGPGLVCNARDRATGFEHGPDHAQTCLQSRAAILPLLSKTANLAVLRLAPAPRSGEVFLLTTRALLLK